MEKSFLKGYYIFNYPIDMVFNILRDYRKLDLVFDDIRTPTKITNGRNTYELGNEFSYFVNGNKITFITVANKNEINFKSIKWRVKTDFIQYEYEYILSRCSVEYKTVLEWKVSFSKPVKMDFEKALDEQSESFLKIDKLLINDPGNLSVSESIVIKASRRSIVSILMKLGKISRNCNFCFGSVKYVGPPDKEQTKVYFRYPMFAIEHLFVVEQADFDNSKYIWTYSMRNLGHLPKESTSLLKLTFRLIRIGEKKTFLEIKQDFNTDSTNLAEKVSSELLITLKYIKSVIV